MTWTIKVRTSPGALMTADYECPIHGRFEAIVGRDAAGDPPAMQHCEAEAHVNILAEDGGVLPCTTSCGAPSPWRISCAPVHTQFVVSATQGKATPKPHKEAMDTRPLAEGRRKEWRQERKQQRIERRHARMKEYLR